MARPNVKRAGMKAEEFFSSLLFKEKLDYTFEDDWYDYLVMGHKVELKSCQMTVKHYSKDKEKIYKQNYSIGRFDFTDKDNRERQIKENIWIALVVRHDSQCIILGFVQAKKLSGKRYLSIHQARDLKPLTFENWLEEIKGDTNE